MDVMSVIDATEAAMAAAIKVLGPEADAGDLAVGILAFCASRNNKAANDELVQSIMVVLVLLVGAKRARELVELVGATMEIAEANEAPQTEVQQ